MEGEIYKVTEENPQISMRISEILREAGLSPGAAEGADLFACFSSDGTVLGIASGKQLGTDSLLLYIAVAAQHRGKGTGSRLVNRILSYYSGLCARIFLVAEEGAVGFFSRFGFREADPAGLPRLIRDSGAAGGTGPASGMIMVLDLPKKWPIL